MNRPLNILCLGAGVQSTTVFHRSGVGELEKLDFAIFADTGWEPREVYDHFAKLRDVFSPRYGIPIYMVSKSNIREDALQSQVRGKAVGGKRWASMPYFTKNPDGSGGMIRRQCTSEYKIFPIQNFIKQEILGLSLNARWPTELKVRQWLGISTDEWGRMRAPTKKTKVGEKRVSSIFGEDEVEPVYEDIAAGWKSHVYPLCNFEFLGPREKRRLGYETMTRQQCEQWLLDNGFGTAPRSACIGCPFHNNAEWRRIRENPEEWKDAVEFDHAIRNCGGMRGQMFIHRQLVPLDEADLSPTARDDDSLFGCDDGVCGV